MNAQALTEFMDSMMNAREDITLNFGKLSLTVSTVSQWLQSLMKRFFACTEGFLQSFQIWSKLEE